MRSKGIRYSQRKNLGYFCRNGQQMPSKNWTDNFVLNMLKSTMEIRNTKLHEVNKPCSMQNYKAVRTLIEMLVLKTVQEMEVLKDICCSKADGPEELRTD